MRLFLRRIQMPEHIKQSGRGGGQLLANEVAKLVIRVNHEHPYGPGRHTMVESTTLRAVVLLLSLLAGRIAISDERMTLSALHAGGWSAELWWSVDIGSSGVARIKLANQPERIIPLSEESLASLRQLLEREKYFDIRANQGVAPSEGFVCELAVTLGGRSKHVRIAHFVPRDISPADQAERSRALRVWDGFKAVVGISDVRDACR
jgi:hypothetical protein